MDFVKTLLLYMTLTFSLNLQAAPTPGEKPAPTPFVNVTVVGEEEGATNGLTARVVGSFVATPAPATPTPLPTITPNDAYTNLGMGDRGDSVRRLQTRLAELGYLQGNIDGAYGYQTRNAVLLFQEYNYLQRDGVAGKSTQTRLFEDPDVIPNPAVITPSPVPTSTPDERGLVPVPEEPMADWVTEEKAQVMVNGIMQTVPETGKAPRVWKRGADVVVSLTDLFASLDLQAEASWGNELSFEYQGYTVAAAMLEQAKEERAEDSEGFSHAYQVTVDGTPVALVQGELMYQDGQWYAATEFFEKTMHAESRWDEEEKTLVLDILDKSLYHSVD